ncbi:MAG: AMP-binding protein [Pseudomonadota bacterium]
MIRFDDVDRSYSSAKTGFRQEIPDTFNFAFDVIDAWATERDKTAVIAVSADGETVTPWQYSDFSDQSGRFGNALLSLGLSKGDFACVVVGRIPEWYSVLFGCMKAGVVSMPGTNLLTSKDIAYRVNHSKAKAVIVTPEHCGKIDEIRADCPSLTQFIVIGDAPDGWLSFGDLCQANDPDVNREAIGLTRSDDMMMAYFTSGTTAMPKMVPRDFGYALAHSATGLFWMDLSEDDVHWTLTDTGWAKAAWGMLFPQFLLGATIVLYNGDKGFDADLHLSLITKLNVTTFCAPPTVYRLFAQKDLKAFDLSSLRRCFGAGEPLNPEVIRYWHENTGTVIADGYGQTETINIVANFPGVPVKHGSMGKPVPGYDVDIVDDAGNRLADGEIGHIAVNTQGEWPAGLFHGYYTGGDLDQSSFRNGWYYTGDTATRDEDGYLWFVGRADDLISSAGYRISPFEVESALLEHDAVAESAVIGVPDETRGQIVMAYIILAGGFEAGEQLKADIQEFCKKQTAPYKYPREIEFVTELPKTISGKIRRVELREKA